MSVQKASDLEEIEVITTGLFIDKLTGINGIARGYITELFGDPGIGKSSLCLQIIAEAQKQGVKCLFVDTEYSYTPRYASNLGVNNEEVGLIRGRYAEEVLDTLESELEGKKWGLIILDSIGGLTPRAEIEKGAGEKVIGAQANLVARFCRKSVPLLSMNKIALIVINHSLVDLMSGKLTTSGGKKLAYHKAIGIRLKGTNKKLMSGETQVGKVVAGQVWGKNKLAGNEGLEIEAQFLFNKGFSASADIFAEALEKGIITKEGQSFFFRSEKLGRGQHASREALSGNEKLLEEIKALL